MPKPRLSTPCVKCGANNFYTHPSKTKNGNITRQRVCKNCQKERLRQYRLTQQAQKKLDDPYKLSKRQYSANDTFLDTVGHEQAWLIGLLAADGCVINDRLFSIAQSGDDGLRIIQTVQQLLNHTGNVCSSKTPRKISHSITITSPQLVARLSDFGIISRKSLVYTFPKIEPEFYASFLRGYVEGDGSIGVYDTGTTRVLCLSFVGTPSFVDVCKNIIPIPGRQRHIKQAKNLDELRFYGQYAIECGMWLWSNEHLPKSRKHDILIDYINTHDPTWQVYDRLKKHVFDMLASGMYPMDIAKTIGLPFGTIYRWIGRDRKAL